MSKLKNLQNKLFPTLIALSALSVSTSAAFYSVSGLSKLFAGASLEVIIMASSLEIAKLVIASLLYQYWDKLNKLLRIYLTVAASVLILITSMGIYGFLSSAYQETANKAGNIDAQVTLLETKRDSYKQQLAIFVAEKESINKNITDLRSGLAGNVQTYKDKQGNVLSSTSSANRKAFEKQLDQATTRQTDVNSKVDELNTKIFDIETQIVDTKTNSEVAGELGPLKYLSGLTGVSMDKIINWLLLIIIFVFDPLAIALVIAANFAFAQLREQYRENIYGETVPIDDKVEGMRKVVEAYDDLEDEIKDWDATLNDGLDDDDLFWDEEDLEILEDNVPWENGYMQEYDEYDLNRDGILDEEELKMKEDDLLNDPSISSYRKNLILRNRAERSPQIEPDDEDLIKEY